MTYLDAAYTILKDAGEPLHFEEITKRALAKQLIAPQGQTPEATMASRLYTNTKQEGSHFVRAERGYFGLVEWQPKGISARVEEINQSTRAALAELLQNISPARFEALIRELLIVMGFDENTVELTRYSADGGIDVTGTFRAGGLTEVSAAVQAKKWKGNVGAPIVTQLRGSLQVHQHGIIITTSDFSKGARKEAAASGKSHIGLINGKELVDLLIRHEVGVTHTTLDVTTVDDEYWGMLADADVQTPEPSAKTATTSEPIEETRESQKPVATDKQIAFVLLGQRRSVTYWRDVLIQSCALLAEQHGPAFTEAATAVKGRTRQYIATSSEGMINPARIPDTDLWVETNQNAHSVVRVIERLLMTLGHDADDIVIGR